MNNSQKYTMKTLSFETIKDAQKLLKNVFNTTKYEMEGLKSSLNKFKYEEYYIKENIDYMQYWVMLDKHTDKVIGITGLYTEHDDKTKHCWLGWFCVADEYRGQRLGQMLLNFSIVQAQEQNFNVMNLYTQKLKKYEVAIKMYESHGFKKYTTGNPANKLFFQKKITL